MARKLHRMDNKHALNYNCPKRFLVYHDYLYQIKTIALP